METCGLLSLSRKATRLEGANRQVLTIDASRLGTDSQPDERICTSRVPSSTHSSTQPRVSLPGSGQRERENTLGRVGLAVQTAHRRANAARLCAYRTRLAITRDEWRLPGIN